MVRLAGTGQIGVLLVTLEGKVGMSTVGLAFLKHLGKFDNIVNDKKSHINRATMPANNIDFLLKERLSQIKLMKKSNLMNQDNFGRNFSNAIKQVNNNSKI